MSKLNEEAADVGQDGAIHDFVQKYDRGHGTYKDPVDSDNVESRLPTVSFPKAPDPSPFSIGPMTPGGRE